MRPARAFYFLYYAALAALMTYLAFHLAPAMPLLDHAVLEALGDRAHPYGRQRVWGALGWAATAPLAGWATSHFGLSWSFFLFLAVMPWVALVALRIPYVAASGKQPIGGGLALVLRDTRWIPLLLAGFAGASGSRSSLTSCRSTCATSAPITG